MPEATILAHVSRTLTVANALDHDAFEIAFAAQGPHAAWLEKAGYTIHPVHTRPREELLARLRTGGSAFDADTLRKYVEDERRVLEKVRPDVVVGDFRPSLSISATLAGIPYVCITNAVWSKYTSFRLAPPRSWGPKGRLGRALMVLSRPFLRLLGSLPEKMVFARYAEPFNEVRRACGLAERNDIRDCMCSDDLTLFADVWEFFPTSGLPSHFKYVGPIQWEPEDNPVPQWWSRLDRSGKLPIVYVTMGSTGPMGEIKALAARLLDEGYQVICTSLEQADPELSQRPHYFARRYLPGAKMCLLAEVVVCHAGNGTIYQALTYGSPVVGVAEFHDQDFNMQRVKALGLGRPARSFDEICDCVRRILKDERYKHRVEAFREHLDRLDGAPTAAREIAAFASART